MTASQARVGPMGAGRGVAGRGSQGEHMALTFKELMGVIQAQSPLTTTVSHVPPHPLGGVGVGGSRRD